MLVAWLRAAPPHDAACGVWFLAGKRERGITSSELQRWAIAASGVPEWLFETARAATGSLPETAALLLGGDRPASDWPLARLVRERLAALATADAAERRRLVTATWSELGADELDLWNRLLVGALRPRPRLEVLARALAPVIGGEPRALEAALATEWLPEPGGLRALVERAESVETGSPDDIATEAGPEGEPGAAAHVFETVLLYAQRSDGGRGAMYSSLTLAAWSDGELVPVARVEAKLAPEEALALDRWVRRNAVARFGPVRHVRPELVFEVACDAVLRSDRHKAGLTLHAPRVLRWRRERTADAAISLAELRARLAD